ncbi:hypothetical protein SH139x_005175 [Planctomycetaceae bacterium SH139]
MAKFYVSSGEICEIVTANDAETAASEALDRFLTPSHWVFDDNRLSDNQRRDHLAIEALLRLDSTIRVSERGHKPAGTVPQAGPGPLDRPDPQIFDTADLLDLHFRLAIAMRRFADRFADGIADGFTGREETAQLSR